MERKDRLRTVLTAAAIVLALAAGVLLGLGLPQWTQARKSRAAAQAGASVVLRCTERSYALTNTQFGYYYWSEYYYFLEVYADYLEDVLDLDAPLAEQEYSDGVSWQDYMIERALETARDTAAMVWAAQEAGYVLAEDAQTSYDETLAAFRKTAQELGYETLTAYLQDSYGENATEESFCAYLHDAYLASDYAESLEAGIVPTGEEVSAYQSAHSGDYAGLDDPAAAAREDLIAETYQNQYRAIVSAQTFEVDYSKIALSEPTAASVTAEK